MTWNPFSDGVLICWRKQDTIFIDFGFYGGSGLGLPPAPCGLCGLYGGLAPMPLLFYSSMKSGCTSISVPNHLPFRFLFLNLQRRRIRGNAEERPPNVTTTPWVQVVGTGKTFPAILFIIMAHQVNSLLT